MTDSGRQNCLFSKVCTYKVKKKIGKLRERERVGEKVSFVYRKTKARLHTVYQRSKRRQDYGTVYANEVRERDN